MRQKEAIMSLLMCQGAMHIKDITNFTKLPAPSVRRVVGQGTLKGIFKRVSAGVYKLNK